jgi:hypothetical protein
VVSARTETRRGSTAEARQEIEQTEHAQVDAQTANRFDIRRVIGGLFLLYGAILFVVGFGASDKDLGKADGININAWTGGCMFVFGALMLGWALLHPIGEELTQGDGDDAAKEA